MSTYDIFSDEQHLVLQQIYKEEPQCVALCKHAAYEEPSTLPKYAFADSDARKFPIHSPEYAVLSHLYAKRQPDVCGDVRDKIARALEAYNVTLPSEPEVKLAAAPLRYLLPQKQAMPVSCADDVRDASHAIIAKAHQLKLGSLVEASVNTVMAARDFGLPVDGLPNDIYKYAGLVTCDAGLLLDHIDARSMACAKPEDAATYEKVASAITASFPPSGMLTRRSDLVKMAKMLHEADTSAGITHLYGTYLQDPLKAVFNLHKFAEETCSIAGVDVPLSKVMALDDGTIDEFVGDGASASKSDPATFKSMIETLPADVQRAMMANLKPYLV